MAVQLTARLDDFGAGAGFDALVAAGSDMSPLMDNIGALLEQSARDRIKDSNVAPDGAPWPPSLRAREGGGRTLFARGRLAASLTHQAGRRQVAVGSNVIYAGVHQGGATIRPVSAEALVFTLPDGTVVRAGSVTIPARPYLGISAEDASEVLALVGAFIEDRLDGAAP